VRIWFVLQRIVRRRTNDVIGLPQFRAHGELHKERFDKFVGLIRSKRCQPDEFAFSRSVPKRVPSRVSAICSDMNRHVRLKNGRIVSASEIVDDSLEKGVCRLGRDKPVCDDALPGHENTTDSDSSPLLQLNDVPFRIARINQTNQTDAFYFRRGNFPHCAPAGCDYCL
jgi:hypothetical protein